MLTASDMMAYLDVYKKDGGEAPFWFHASRVYAQIGSILRRGSRLLDNRAAAIYKGISTDPEKLETISRLSRRMAITMNHMTELLVRKYLGEEVVEILGTALPVDVCKRLKPTLLDIIYPSNMRNGQLSANRA